MGAGESIESLNALMIPTSTFVVVIPGGIKAYLYLKKKQKTFKLGYLSWQLQQNRESQLSLSRWN